jgi:ATP-binding cassette subfamily F protein uup
MSLISLNNIKLSFPASVIFEDLNLQIENNQRICLLGRNGCGKTSLMRIIAGEIKPDSGQVHVSQGVRISYFAQEIPEKLDDHVFNIIAGGLGKKGQLLIEYHQKEKMLETDPEKAVKQLQTLREKIDETDAWSCIDEIGKVTSRLMIDSEWSYNQLSGGQKRRVLLAKALVSKPDLLLLDEPTNHLDIDTIAWLEEFLLNSTTTLLFVTHDRMVLRRLATRIVEIDRGQIYDWETDYDTFLKRREEVLLAEQKAQKRFDRKLAAEEAWIRKGVRARRRRNEGRVRALQRMREERKQRKSRAGNVNLQINKSVKSGKDVITAENISFSFPGKKILSDFSLQVRRGDKIGIIGPNGCGKTTLIKLLVGELKPRQGTIEHGTNLEIAYYDQLRNILDENETIWENVCPGGDRVNINGHDVHIISYLESFLFSSQRAKSKISVLSGGERNRVMLAKLFAQPANLLVLDEPTNDLDIETLELLEEMLSEFNGTVLVICHDRTFLNNLVSSTIVFAANGEVKEIVGGYDDWIAERKIEKQRQDQAEHEAVKNKQLFENRQKKKRAKKGLSYKEKREFEALPELLEKNEAEMHELQQSLANPEFFKDGAKVKFAQKRLFDLENQNLEILERWEELEKLDAEAN